MSVRTVIPPHHWSLIALAVACLLAIGCSSTKPRTRPDVTVTYRFENVRKQGGFDEWDHIRPILAKHSRQEVRPEFARARSVGDAELREIKADVVVPDFATLDHIQDELDNLAEQTRKPDSSWWGRINPFSSDEPARTTTGQAIEFSMASANLRFVSNYITSSISVTIAGYTQPDNIVTLYVDSISPPIVVRADRSGLWRASARVLPEAGFIFGQSEDASRRTRPKHFRINTTTLRHENISREEFESRRPVYTPPPAATNPSSSPSQPAPTGSAPRAR